MFIKPCQTCAYWNIGTGAWEIRDAQGQTIGRMGDCRRHAPSLTATRLWPATRSDDGCGDWEQVETVS